jgi:hypothetical protein
MIRVLVRLKAFWAAMLMTPEIVNLYVEGFGRAGLSEK